ncbi:hypothetical protein C9993_04795 [Marinobacter sp. Z-F4-2]|nr:hypothetical protein C9993_04795 [Marinobacter sp. Z-F4-2]
MTQIKVRQESFRVDYTRGGLPPLFWKQKSDCDFSASTILEFVYSEDLVSLVGKARLTLLVACDQIQEKEFILALQEAADRGVRIYLLLGDPQPNHTAIDSLSGRCLIRSGVKQKGALMLVDHTTTQAQGFLITGPQPMATSDGGDWGIQLEQRQIDDSFRSFCKLFWEDADSEYLKQNLSRETVAHPDGSIVTNHSHQLRGTLEDCLAATRANLLASSNLALDIESGSHQLLLNIETPDIHKVARKGVSLTESSIPTVLFSERDNWLLPDSADFAHTNWCLKLSESQHRALSTEYEQAMVKASWQFLSEMTIGDIPTEQSLRFIDQPDLVRSIEQVRRCTLEDIDTNSIDGFLEDDAETLASGVIGWQRDFLAHQIDYLVTIHPPYCPSTATRDELYKQWQRAEEDWQAQLSSLERLQEKIEARQNGVADHLKGFLNQFFLGQHQSVKRMNQELEELKTWSVTEATPSEREEKKRLLEELQDRIGQRERDTAEKLNEAEQCLAWQEKRLKLEEELLETEKLVRSKTDFWQALLNKSEESQSRIEQAFLEAWKEAAEKLDESKLEEGQTRETLQSMSSEQAQQWRDKFKNKIWKKHYSLMEKALEDRRLALSKIERDIQEAERARDNSRSEHGRAQDKLDAHGTQFVYRPEAQTATFDKQLGLTNAAPLIESFTWPTEELPVKGLELRSLEEQRFLVIDDTEQLEQARRDAERLNARIVCNTETAHA